MFGLRAAPFAARDDRQKHREQPRSENQETKQEVLRFVTVVVLDLSAPRLLEQRRQRNRRSTNSGKHRSERTTRNRGPLRLPWSHIVAAYGSCLVGDVSKNHALISGTWYSIQWAVSADRLRLFRGLDTGLSRPSMHFHAHESRSHEYLRTFSVLKHKDYQAALESDMSYDPCGADVGCRPQIGSAGCTAIN